MLPQDTRVDHVARFATDILTTSTVHLKNVRTFQFYNESRNVRNLASLQYVSHESARRRRFVIALTFSDTFTDYSLRSAMAALWRADIGCFLRSGGLQKVSPIFSLIRLLKTWMHLRRGSHGLL